MSIALSKDELVEITGYKQSQAQASALHEMNIPFRRRPNGTILVIREAVHATSQPKPKKRASFNPI